MSAEPEGGWETVTYEGNVKAQIRRALALTLRERFEAVEELADLSRRFEEMRQTGKFLAPD